MALERELETYRNKLPELKGENEGRFVLIKGDQVIDVFSSYDDALKAGYTAFGLEPFLVKRIEAIPEVACAVEILRQTFDEEYSSPDNLELAFAADPLFRELDRRETQA
jgi:hypothetical protein